MNANTNGLCDLLPAEDIHIPSPGNGLSVQDSKGRQAAYWTPGGWFRVLYLATGEATNYNLVFAEGVK